MMCYNIRVSRYRFNEIKLKHQIGKSSQVPRLIQIKRIQGFYQKKKKGIQGLNWENCRIQEQNYALCLY